MSIVTVSSKFQIVIPEDIRKKMAITKSQKLVVLEKDGAIQILPIKPIKQTRGFAKGLDTFNLRDEGD